MLAEIARRAASAEVVSDADLARLSAHWAEGCAERGVTAPALLALLRCKRLQVSAEEDHYRAVSVVANLLRDQLASMFAVHADAEEPQSSPGDEEETDEEDFQSTMSIIELLVAEPVAHNLSSPRPPRATASPQHQHAPLSTILADRGVDLRPLILQEYVELYTVLRVFYANVYMVDLSVCTSDLTGLSPHEELIALRDPSLQSLVTRQQTRLPVRYKLPEFHSHIFRQTKAPRALPAYLGAAADSQALVHALLCRSLAPEELLNRALLSLCKLWVARYTKDTAAAADYLLLHSFLSLLYAPPPPLPVSDTSFVAVYNVCCTLVEDCNEALQKYGLALLYQLLSRAPNTLVLSLSPEVHKRALDTVQCTNRASPLLVLLSFRCLALLNLITSTSNTALHFSNHLFSQAHSLVTVHRRFSSALPLVLVLNSFLVFADAAVVAWNMDLVLDTLLCCVNMWHLPLQLACVRGLEVLLLRCALDAQEYAPLLFGELLRVELFYSAGNPDLSSASEPERAVLREECVAVARLAYRMNEEACDGIANAVGLESLQDFVTVVKARREEEFESLATVSTSYCV